MAEFIADEYFPVSQVNPLKIIQRSQITYSFGDYQDAFDGLLEYKNSKFHVFLNKNRLEDLDKPRSRFTAGHELGHFFIDKHRNALISGKISPHPSFSEYQSDSVIEMEADHFASNLLMPPTRFSVMSKKSPIGLEGIRKIAQIFGTSLTASAVRYVKLEIVPCALLKWKDGKLQWKWLSTEVFRRKMRKTVEDVGQLPEGSATLDVAKANARGSEILRVGTTASIWFPYVSDKSTRDEILIEESISLGRFGILTFLYPEKTL